MKRTLLDVNKEEKRRGQQRITMIGFVLILVIGIVLILLITHR